MNTEERRKVCGEGELLDTIYVTGGNTLKGETKIQGSKNASLPVLAATLLVKGCSVIRNCPRIADVCHMENLLRSLGCQISWCGNTITVNAAQIRDCCMSGESVTRMRSSVMLLGPLLGRLGETEMDYPGGCVIGRRPIDLHLWALRQMGVEIREGEHGFRAEAVSLRGAEVRLPFPSVGATENILLAAVLAEGVTVLDNAAREPEISVLCDFLSAAGARIEGGGSSRIVVHGVRQLQECRFRIPSDRIVAGTYLIAALAAGGSIFLEEAPWKEMESLLTAAQGMGCGLTATAEGLGVDVFHRMKACPYLQTRVYDGFPTDLQSPMMAALTVARGDSVIEENIFENRFRIVEDLKRMGAEIEVRGSRARVHGVERLKAAEVTAGELRGGAALVVAGLAAEGRTVIRNRHFVERGYENICRDLRNLGGDLCCGEH